MLAVPIYFLRVGDMKQSAIYHQIETLHINLLVAAALTAFETGHSDLRKT